MDVDGSTSSFPVAAVIVSSSKSDADSNGDWFDDITSGTHKGNNSTGQPNYIRSFPLSDFDDLVLYIGDNELYGKFCESLVLAVNNTSGSTVYVWNQTQGIDLDSDGLESPESGVFRIISGTEIQLRTANLGGGSIVPSKPTTPIILAGTGCTIGCTIGFETSTLVVNNNSKKDVWVWNQTRGESLGKVKKNKQETYLISSETEIQLRTKDNGGGSIVSSTPTTPIILAGGDFQIDVS